MSSLHQTRYEIETSTTAAPEGNTTARSTGNVASNLSPHLVNANSETINGSPLSIALISPNETQRSAAVAVLNLCGGNEVCQFSSYPPQMDDVTKMLEGNYDAVIVELGSNPEYALDLVESIGANGRATVMVYSDNTNSEMLVRCMQAGAREFLTYPISNEVMAEALVRATARRPVVVNEAKAAGRLLTVMGAKGGAGATMLACNLAVALALEKNQKTLLIDLDLPLGDAALNLGIVAEFSTIDALDAADRLDARFLSQLLVKHSTGLSLLAAPGKFVPYQASDRSIERLIQVARQEFDNVVLDLGSKLDLMGTAAYQEASTVYLVTQASIPELRNSNRLISQFFSGSVPKLEVVINRFEMRTMGVSEEHINKALTRPAQWKIPNDFASVRKMQIHATPLVMEDSPITRQIKKMAKAVTGEQDAAPAKTKKKGFRLF
ncbi:MAG: AAA family ATPase [Terracidiphilus sp.]|jgi:pilus assembly protein CpaE